MTKPLINTLEHRGDALAVYTHPDKRRHILRTNLITVSLQIGFGIYVWTQHSLLLILISIVISVLVLPLSAFALWIEWRASRRTTADIEIAPEALRFYLAGDEPIVLRPGEIAGLTLMPSTFGQTLVVAPAQEFVLRSRLPLVERLYLAMSKLYCGHGIGLTPNLGPEDFRAFSQALDRTFPNIVSVCQKAHEPPPLARFLGNTKPHEAPLAVHVPPPLSKA
jgi:hypothetical protein